MTGSTLDVIDQAILYHLQQDGRRPITDIAGALDVSDNTVRNRMAAMEESGVISGYRATINYDNADVQHYYLFVCSVRVSDRERLASQVEGLPGVLEVITLMTGTHNVYVIGAGTDKDDMTGLAYEIDDSGLSIEREHLIRDHQRRAYSGFQPPEYAKNK